MPFENLISHIRQRADAYNQPTALEGIAHDLADALRDGAPKDTGVLAEAVSEVGPVSKEEGGWSIGVGNAQRLGTDTHTPAGTIAAFLEDNPKYRFGGEGYDDKGDKGDKKDDDKAGVWTRFEKRLAWWFLPPKGKKALQEARAGGLYGGPAGNAGDPAKYYPTQDQEKGEWEASAYGAGLEDHGTRFTTAAIREWRGKLSGLIKRYVNAG